MVELTGFHDEVDVGTGKEGVKYESRDFGLSNTNNGVAIH